MLFLSSKKLSSLWGYSHFCISVFPFPVDHCFRGWSKINLKTYLRRQQILRRQQLSKLELNVEKEKIYDIETLSIDTVLNEEHFYEKIKQKICIES